MLRRRTSPLIAAPLFALLLAACSDDSDPLAPPEPTSSVATIQSQGIPTRAEESPNSWAARSDADLWARLAETDSTAIIGLQAPGAPRSNWRGKLLLSHSQWQEAHRAVVAQRGVTLIEADTLLPAVKVKIADEQAFQTVRRLPVVDYVEPVFLTAVGDGWASTCAKGDPASGTIKIGSGDIVHSSFRDMAIEMAWARSQGAGVTLGLVDTGISPNQPELQAYFASGESTGRSIDSYNNGVTCSHGTRMAGVMVAPKNGREAVGVAYRSGLISYDHADNVWGLNGYDAAQGIRYTAGRGAKAIGLAFQVESGSSYIMDEIRYWYYNYDRLFIGAAGTSDSYLPVANSNVLFPAEMAEVFAVTGADPGDPNYPCYNCHYGSKVELAAYINQTTHGMDAGYLTNINGSSVSVATITGVAGLIWSRWPAMSRADVMSRLRFSGQFTSKTNGIGYGIVNAHKALGGLYYLSINGCATDGCKLYYKIPECTTYSYYLGRKGGDGPFTYRWTDGSAGTTTTKTLCPRAGTTEYYSIGVSVKDGSDGTSLYRSIRIEVVSSNEGECPTCPV